MPFEAYFSLDNDTIGDNHYTPTLMSNDSFENGTGVWDEEFDPLYQVPNSIVALLSVFYGTISFLAVVGNSLVMWIVATSRRMQNVTNCFIANLALADIVIGLFAIPFQFQAALLQRWNLPHFMCAFCPFVQVLSVTVSIFTLTAIAVDRHRAILNPLRARPSKNTAKLIIAGIWLVAGCLATPMAIALRVVMVEESDPDNPRIIHRKPFCHNVHLSDSTMIAYRFVLVFLQYLTPLCVISFVYAHMALKLWGSHAPGNAQSTRDANIMKNKKKVIKMLVIVVALFAVCWLPLQTYNLLQDPITRINDYKYINIIWFICDWLAMSNSCCNPFIYGIYNEKFKREFQQRFPCHGRAWGSSPPTDSFDLDKHSTHTRMSSVRSSYDCKRSFATRNNQLSCTTTLTKQNPECSNKTNNKSLFEIDFNKPKSKHDLYDNTNTSCSILIRKKCCNSDCKNNGKKCVFDNAKYGDNQRRLNNSKHSFTSNNNSSKSFYNGVNIKQPHNLSDEHEQMIDNPSIETELFVFTSSEVDAKARKKELWL